MPSGPEIRGRITADGRGWTNALKGAKGEANRFAVDIKGLFKYFTAAALIESGRRMIEFGGKIGDAAKKIGVTTTSLQEMLYAATQSGAGLEDITRSFKELAKNRDAALKGNGEKISAFSALGIDMDELKSGSIESIFKHIAETIRTTDFGADTEPLIEKVLGKSGVELLPMFIEGIKKAADEAHALGIILEEKVVENLDKVGDAIDKLSAMLRGPTADATVTFAGAIEWMVKKSLQQLEMLGRGFALIGYIMKMASRGDIMSFGHPKGLKNDPQFKSYVQGFNKSWDDLLGIGAGPAQAGLNVGGGAGAAGGEVANRKKGNINPYIGGSPSEIDDEMLKFHERIRDIQGQGLTDKEKELRLQKEINDLLAEAAMFEGVGMTWEALQSKNDAAEKGNELAGMLAGQKFSPMSDQLSRIGGFTGASSASQNPSLDIKQKVGAILQTLNTGIVLKVVE